MKPSHINLHVARQIARHRREKGIPVASMCEELMITQSMYSRVENGFTQITLHRLYVIAELLGVNARDLLPEEAK